MLGTGAFTLNDSLSFFAGTLHQVHRQDPGAFTSIEHGGRFAVAPARAHRPGAHHDGHFIFHAF